jgi:serine/threonine-protein kinase HipA
MKSTLTVRWDKRVVGELRLSEHGEMSFAYDHEWLGSDRPGISISLPKREEIFSRRECRPFFAGLLPEESQREHVAKALGLSQGNDFALLKALGGDVAGAITFWPEDEEAFPEYDGAQAREPLGDNALIELLDTLPKRPLLAGQEGMRLSLAGAQAKVPVVLVNNKVALALPGQPTTHILKPPIGRFPATTENEAYVMQLAAAIGLPVAPAEPRKIGDRLYLLVTRYDRATTQDGSLRRLHQEDFCQALSIPPEHKYAAEGGPTFRNGFELLRKTTARPALEVLKLLDAAIFNLIAGNADAHGKNYSLLYKTTGLELAPLYDLLCTVSYPQLSAKLAMKVGGAARIEDVDQRTWEKFSREADIGLQLVKKRAEAIGQSVRGATTVVADQITANGFDADVLHSYADVISDRAERVLTKLHA